MRKKLFLFFLLFFLLVSNGCSAAINIEVPLFNTPNPTLPQYIVFFFQMAMALGGILAVLSLVFSGIQFIYSSGNPGGIGEAKKRAQSAILGIIILLSSFMIITTINPKLENVEFTEGLKPIGVLFFTGGNSGEKPAPMRMENLDVIKQEYKKIEWKATITDTLGNQINNCDPKNPNAVYVVYWYKDYNFENVYSVDRLKCGQPIDFSGNSYLIVKETPGVYFYDGKDCYPAAGSKNVPVTPHTQNIPEDAGMDGQTVHSIRIVNGPDPKKGPFFGLIYFNSTDYRTSENVILNGFQHFMFSTGLSEENIFDNNSRCFSGNQIGSGNGLISKGSSYVIYKWVGFKEDGTPASAGANGGITLYTEVSWLGGYYQQAPPWMLWMQINLPETPVFYPANTTIPKERRDLCKFFNPEYSCLKSFEIKGNYLVLVSSGEDKPYKYNKFKAQVFPISSRLQENYGNRPTGYSIERGTPELKTDYIGDKSAYFIKIIPLAERLR